MPRPKTVYSIKVWSVAKLARAFDALPGDVEDGADEQNEWDEYLNVPRKA